MKDVLVADYAAEGKSLARVDGKVIFMENAIPGDIVDVKLVRNKKDWADGHVIHYHQYAKERLEPFCSHFGVCGGCQWQMLPYEKQLFYKQQQVADNLKRIGKLDLPPIEPIIGAVRQRGYRNKIEYTFSKRRFLKKEDLADPLISSAQNVAGFHAKGIFDKVVDIDTCYLQEEPTNKIRHAIKNWGIANGSSFYDIRMHEGWLRTMQVRICLTGEIMVNLVLGHEDEPMRTALLETLRAQFPEITTLLYTINPKWNDSLQDLVPKTCYGKGYVIEKLENFRFKIGPKSFFQTNSEQAEKLYKVTREFAELEGRETVYDLYCGTGSIGIFLSRGAARIIGVELVPEAIQDAKENATLNQISHAHFFAGDVTEICNNAFFLDQGKPDVIITDPPRSGMHEDLVKKILEMEASRVVYVSCNPATQARDLGRMSEKYEVKRIQPVDMFPHTHHIENIVQLKLRS
ncbi:MAG: 23S rRNA (uracil(1939)-C(5))-methyltransferase RlmD [Chitinophagales bacterium]